MNSQTSSTVSRQSLSRDRRSFTPVTSTRGESRPRAGLASWFAAASAPVLLALCAATVHADPLDHWTKVPRTPTTEYQTEAIFVNGKYWAVSFFGDMQYSADGQTWTDVQTNTFKDLRSIAYGNGRYVIVGASRIILSSPDGIDWTTHKQLAGDAYSEVIFANGKFLAVSASGETQASTNGIDWTTGSLDAPGFTAWGLTWGNGLYIVVGQGEGSTVLTSPDGITWTERTHPLLSTLTSVCHGNGLFVAVGTEAIGTSPDGITWTKRAGPFPNSAQLERVKFINGRFIAAGWYGTLMSSPDGTVWTTHPTGTEAHMRAFAYNGARLLTFRYGEGETAGPWVSDPWAPAAEPVDPNASAQIANISTRAWVGSSESMLISGFAIKGGAPKTVLIRAVGPTLATFGVQGTLVDPQVKVFNDANAEVASNGDWSTSPNKSAIDAATAAIGAFELDAGSKDAALVATLAPGSYTIQVSGADGGTGIALAEVYDSDEPGSCKVVNISSRAFSGTGESATIPGFVVSGNAPKKLLVRAVGPTLGSFGVPGVMADPKFSVFDSANIKVGENDNWGAVADQAALVAATAAVGAFNLNPGSLDAATIVTVNPGAYTVVVSGNAGATGVGLVEVYEIP